MPALRKRRWTAADVRALIDENRHWPRYELLDGELLVTPSPSRPHQLAVTRLAARLTQYCELEGIGSAFVSPADIALAPESIMQPDVFVVPEALLRGTDRTGWTDVRWLLLAVEVVSPSSARQDRVQKRDFYLANGVREYWVVDPDARIVERWTPEQEHPQVHRDVLEWHPAGSDAPFTLEVQRLFA